MNIKNWNRLYRYHQGKFCPPQKLYEPLINPERTVLCKNYNHTDQLNFLGNNYLEIYKKEAVDWFFQKEVYYLEKSKNLFYAPDVIDIDFNKKHVFIEWNDFYCNEHIYFYQKWPVDDWLYQLKQIVLEQVNQKIYKLTLDSHSHFIDKNGEMKAFDFYGTVPIDNPTIPRKMLETLYQEKIDNKIFKGDDLGNDSIDLEKKFKRSLYEKVKWGDYSLITIYNHLFNTPNGDIY